MASMVRIPYDMTTKSKGGLNRQVIALSVAFWTAYFIMLLTRGYFGGLSIDFAFLWTRLASVVAAIALTYGIHIVFRRHMPDAPMARFARAGGLGFLATVLFTVVSVAAVALATTGRWQDKWAEFAAFQNWLLVFTSNLWLLLAWTAIYTVLVNAADLRERDRRLAEAERTAQEAQLAALRLQIHPHFLFNALNALSSLINLGRGEDAQEMILNLSSFLRRTLTANPSQMTTLRDEIDVQLMYLGIEQTRFCDRLKVECQVPQDCMDALVPNLILQPLIENVIKHALHPSEDPVTITIGATHHDDVLDVWVRDNGSAARPGLPGLGIGLRNVEKRLQARFGDAGRFEAGRDGTGWVSRITLPWMVPCAS